MPSGTWFAGRLLSDGIEEVAPAKREFLDLPGTAYAIAGSSRGHPTILNSGRTVSDIRLLYSN
jgi:hypothetical protein